MSGRMKDQVRGARLRSRDTSMRHVSQLDGVNAVRIQFI